MVCKNEKFDRFQRRNSESFQGMENKAVIFKSIVFQLLPAFSRMTWIWLWRKERSKEKHAPETVLKSKGPITNYIRREEDNGFLKSDSF